jgi:hypothetical protein
VAALWTCGWSSGISGRSSRSICSALPLRVHKDIIRFFLLTNIELFPLARALCHLRGPWCTLTVNKITMNLLLFIQTLSDGRRLRRADLLDFSSSIGFVPYPKAELLDFATRISYQAESARRICTALRFVLVALAGGWRDIRSDGSCPCCLLRPPEGPKVTAGGIAAAANGR